MDEHEFLTHLKSRLEQSGVEAAYVEKYVRQFRCYFDNLPQEDIAEHINSLGDMDNIVENLINLINAKKAMRKSPSVSSSQSENKKKIAQENYENNTVGDDGSAFKEPCRDSESVSEKIEKSSAKNEDAHSVIVESADGLTEEDSAPTEEIKTIKNNSETVENIKSEKSAEDLLFDEAFPNDDKDRNGTNKRELDKNSDNYFDSYILNGSEGEYISEIDEKPEVRNIFGQIKKRSRIEDEYGDYEGFDSYDEYVEYHKKIEDANFFGNWEKLETDKSKKLFYGIGLGSLPFSIAAFLAINGVFAAMFILLGAVVAALILLLIGITAAGAAASIAGIVYGVVKCFSVAPIGIYEIGVGIKCAGYALALGILDYNLAVRVMPIAIKYLLGFYFTVLRYIKLYIFKFRRYCSDF